MTYEEFQSRTEDRDYILIKMSDHFPFFQEKVFMQDGKKRVETNYHVADGMFSCYVNFEMNGISVEVTGAVRFEISGSYDCPVYVTNIGTDSFEMRLPQQKWMFDEEGYCYGGELLPGEVLAIYPEEGMRETAAGFHEEQVRKWQHREGFMHQSEINALLGGEYREESVKKMENRPLLKTEIVVVGKTAEEAVGVGKPGADDGSAGFSPEELADIRRAGEILQRGGWPFPRRRSMGWAETR